MTGLFFPCGGVGGNGAGGGLPATPTDSQNYVASHTLLKTYLWFPNSCSLCVCVDSRSRRNDSGSAQTFTVRV